MPCRWITSCEHGSRTVLETCEWCAMAHATRRRITSMETDRRRRLDWWRSAGQQRRPCSWVGSGAPSPWGIPASLAYREHEPVDVKDVWGMKILSSQSDYIQDHANITINTDRSRVTVLRTCSDACEWDMGTEVGRTRLTKKNRNGWWE